MKLRKLHNWSAVFAILFTIVGLAWSIYYAYVMMKSDPYLFGSQTLVLTNSTTGVPIIHNFERTFSDQFKGVALLLLPILSIALLWIFVLVASIRPNVKNNVTQFAWIKFSLLSTILVIFGGIALGAWIGIENYTNFYNPDSASAFLNPQSLLSSTTFSQLNVSQLRLIQMNRSTNDVEVVFMTGQALVYVVIVAFALFQFTVDTVVFTKNKKLRMRLNDLKSSDIVDDKDIFAGIALEANTNINEVDPTLAENREFETPVMNANFAIRADVEEAKSIAKPKISYEYNNLKQNMLKLNTLLQKGDITQEIYNFHRASLISSYNASVNDPLLRIKL